MKRTRIWLLGAFVLVSALLVGAIIQRNRNPLYQLSRYPKTPVFKRYVLDMSSKMQTPMDAGKPFLDIHEPEDRTFERVLSYEVIGDGRFKFNTLSVRAGLVSDYWQANLSAGQNALIKKLVRQLPPSSAPVEREDLIVVITNDPAPAQLRLYDRKNLPPQIHQIINILTPAIQKGFASPDMPHLRSTLRSSNQIPRTP